MIISVVSESIIDQYQVFELVQHFSREVALPQLVVMPSVRNHCRAGAVVFAQQNVAVAGVVEDVVGSL